MSALKPLYQMVPTSNLILNLILGLIDVISFLGKGVCSE